MKQAQFNFLLLFIIISSCKTSIKKEEFAELLSNPPYTELTDSITKFPGNDQLFINRGILLTKQGQFAAAVNDFEKAWTLKQTEDAAVFYAAGLINSKKYDNAISHLKTATGKFPQNLVLMERLGYAFEQKNDYLSASKVYEGILRIDSTDFRTWAARAFCYQELNNDEEAIRSFEKSYQLEPNQSVGIELASMYAETKNPKTIAFCDGIIKADTATVKNIQPFYCKGRYYKNTGNYALAKPLYEKCIREDYSFAYAYLDLSVILYDEKNYVEAIKLLEIAKKVDNQNPEPYYRMGKCLEAVNNKSDAKLEYERALALDGNYTVAKEALENMQ